MRAQLSSENLQSKDGKKEKKKSQFLIFFSLVLFLRVLNFFYQVQTWAIIWERHCKKLSQWQKFLTVDVEHLLENQTTGYKVYREKKNQSCNAEKFLVLTKPKLKTQKKRKKIWKIKMFLFNSMVWESRYFFIDNSYAWCYPSLRAPNPSERSTSWISFCLWVLIVDLILLLLRSRASNLTYPLLLFLRLFTRTSTYIYMCVYYIDTHNEKAGKRTREVIK